MMWSPDVMVFVFLAVGAVALFSFLSGELVVAGPAEGAGEPTTRTTC